MYPLVPHMHRCPIIITSTTTRMVHLLQLLNLHPYVVITQSPQFALGFALGVERSMSLDKYIMMYPPLECLTKCFHCPEAPLFFFSFHSVPRYLSCLRLSLSCATLMEDFAPNWDRLGSNCCTHIDLLASNSLGLHILCCMLHETWFHVSVYFLFLKFCCCWSSVCSSTNQDF